MITKNNAGRLVFQADKWDVLYRSLIVGNDQGTMHANEKDTKLKMTDNLKACIKEDAGRVLNTAVDISTNGKSPKRYPSIYALVSVMKLAEQAGIRALAGKYLTRVAPEATSMYYAASVAREMGISRVVRNAWNNWYAQDANTVALQMIKYRSRAIVEKGSPSDTWTHADVLNIMHPRAASDQHANLMRWAVLPKEDKLKFAFKNMDDSERAYQMIRAYHEIQDGDPSTQRIINLIYDLNLPWEVLPTERLNQIEIWEALLPRLGATALLRQTWRFEEQGFFRRHTFREMWASRILDERVIKGKLHPIQVYIALKARTHDQFVSHVLSELFDKAMHLPLEPINKRLILAIDSSGSMGMFLYLSKEDRLKNRNMTNISAREASIVMSSVFLRKEPVQPLVLSWSEGERSVREISFSDMRVDYMVRDFNRQASSGGTDLSSPLRYVVSHHLENKYDGMIIFTDDETWRGPELPMTWLMQVWAKNPNFKLMTCSVAAYDFTNFVRDPRTLDTAGFDSSLYQVAKSMF